MGRQMGSAWATANRAPGGHRHSLGARGETCPGGKGVSDALGTRQGSLQEDRAVQDTQSSFMAPGRR